MRGVGPRNVAEFREKVPLTTYADYLPYLAEKREDVLPRKPIFWQRTSGRSSESSFKWAPVTQRMAEELGPTFLALLIFATCKRREDFPLKENEKFLYTLAPSPYTSGAWAKWGVKEFPVEFIPPLDEAEEMSFEDRIQKGFQLALKDGATLLAGVSVVLVAIGEKLNQRQKDRDILPLLSKPDIAFRLGKGFLRSKLARRPMLPKDLWSLKGLIAGGTDTAIYKDKISKMWGRYPLNVYGCAESIIIAMQTWDYEGMTFVPNFNFLEFIPETEHLRLKADPSYQPVTVLLDEVKPGNNYEILLTNFHGGPFVRYRVGDMVQITSFRNERINIDIPQMAFHSRVDDIIHFAGPTPPNPIFLTEKIIWQAIEGTGLTYADWTARKEAKEGKPVLHLYLELKGDGKVNESEIANNIHSELKKLDDEYATLETFLGLRPPTVTLLPEGAFHRYISKQRAAGTDLGHLKPPRINCSDRVIGLLRNGTSSD